MSFENAKENLKEFGKELNLEGLEFDENNTCILGIDNEFSLHITYEPNSDRLYLYSPILDGLPQDDKTKLALYEKLLKGSMLGGQMAGGGVGVATEEQLILMHTMIEMGLGVDTAALRRFAPLFVETVGKWRDMVQKILVGQDPGEFELPLPPGAQHPGGPGFKSPNAPKPKDKGDGGDHYIKI